MATASAAQCILHASLYLLPFHGCCRLQVRLVRHKGYR